MLEVWRVLMGDEGPIGAGSASWQVYRSAIDHRSARWVRRCIA